MASGGLTILWFLGIVALIPLTLWGLKKSGLAQGAVAGASAAVKTIGQLNIGPGQRIVTVEVGTGDERKWLVLGVTAQQIQTLHTMNPQAGVPTDMPAAMPFTSLLRRASQQQAGEPKP